MDKRKRTKQFCSDKFVYDQQCLFCKADASDVFIHNQLKKIKGKRISVCRVTKKETVDNIVGASLRDVDDIWCEEVCKRVMQKDLVSLNARYHKLCYSKFLSCEKRMYDKRGRPISEDIETKMQEVYKYVNSMEYAHFTLEEIRDAFDYDLPDKKTFKRKLLAHYGEDNLLVIDMAGKSTIYCLVSTAKRLLREKWFDNRYIDEKEEALGIVCTAAHIVLEDILAPPEDITYSPGSSVLDDTEDFIPETLKLFVETMVTKYKETQDLTGTVTSICRLLMKTARSEPIVIK